MRPSVFAATTRAVRRAFCSGGVGGAATKLPEVTISDELVSKLERLSALRMTEEERRWLAEDIQLAQRLFEVDTNGVKPLLNIAEDYIVCPLRDDLPAVPTSQKETLMNARKNIEGFFVAPTVGVVDKRKDRKRAGKDDDEEDSKEI